MALDLPAQLLIQEYHAGMTALGDLGSQPQLLANLPFTVDHVAHGERGNLTDAQPGQM
ncbi:hypothetical protein D3C87_2023790 [compost metagenome]